MPRGDRSGPSGAGPRTGRGAGWCSGYDRPGYANLAPGFGAGFGHRGGGRGWRNWFYATGIPGWARGGSVPVAPQEPVRELASLRTEASLLVEQLEAIRRRIETLGGGTPQP
jgi:hypothetical protein